jgi:hypothetical protein
MRRHWITTALAWLCFATAAAEFYGLCLFSGPGETGNAPLSIAIWRFLGLFPTPAVICWPVNFIVASISPALISSKAYTGVLSVLTFVVSVGLGIAILRVRSWARAALMTICALTIVAQLYALFRLVSYSPGLLIVLQSNYRGASSTYVSGAGPGSFLASLAIAIALLWLLIRNGLPSVDQAGSTGLPGKGAVGQAQKFVLYATASVFAIEIFLLLAGFGTSGPDANHTRLLLCLLLSPHALILVRSWHGTDRLSLGLAAGYGVLVAYIGALFLPALLFGLAWIVTSHQSGGMLQYLLLAAIPLLQCGVAISAITVTRSLPPAPATSAKLGVWGLAFLIPVVAGTAAPQFYSDWQRGTLPVPGTKSSGDEYHELMKHDADARDLVRKFGYCAFLYAKLHPEEGFPENAEKMGPRGSACLTREDAAGHLEGYFFRYAVHKSEGSTRFDRFTAAAQWNNTRQISGVLMDEKGVEMLVHSQEIQSQLVTADQISWGTPGMTASLWGSAMPSMLPRIVTCAAMLRDQSANGEFPATLAEVLRMKIKPNDRDCINLYQVGDQLLQAAGNANRTARSGDVVEYQPQRDASGEIGHFYFTLRPEHYGVDGVRSYFTDDSGEIHATSEDRSATADDPAPLSCEVEANTLCEDAKAP